MRQLENFVERESGLIVPFAAMPGDHDYQGTLGAESYEFLRFMRDADIKILHDLPSTPPDRYNCPYSSVSSFALNFQSVDPEFLAMTGDLSKDELEAYQRLMSSGDAGREIKDAKEALLRTAYDNFVNNGSPRRRLEFAKWRRDESEWLDSYAAFELLCRLPQNVNKRWKDWEIGKDYSPELVDTLKSSRFRDFSAICYMQWVAEGQMQRYLDFADSLGIQVWGDVPFYTGDGEVWANRSIFDVDSEGNQINQGGAPPSDTSADGQKWGNATYKFDPVNHPVDTIRLMNWWERRLKRAKKLSRGKVRLDHFIGLAEPYILDADAKTGEGGWRDDGLGRLLFARLGNDLDYLYPEDLGEMTEVTRDLRDDHGLLTSKLSVRGLTKHLARGADLYVNSENNPANYTRRTVGFTSNHDSPTLVQTFQDLRDNNPEAYRNYIDYINSTRPEQRVDVQAAPETLAKIEVERVVRSVARYAFVGIWDALLLGKEGRYNTPSTINPSNWSWRMSTEQMHTLRLQAPYWKSPSESSDSASLRIAS